MRDREQAQGPVNGRTLAPFPLETVRIGMQGPISVVDLTNLPGAPPVLLETVVDLRGASPRIPGPAQVLEAGSLVLQEDRRDRPNTQALPAALAAFRPHM